MSAVAAASHRVIRDDASAAARSRRRVGVSVAQANRRERNALRINSAAEIATSMARFPARIATRPVRAVSQGARQMRASRSRRRRVRLASGRGRSRSPGREPTPEAQPRELSARAGGGCSCGLANGHRCSDRHGLRLVAVFARATT